MSIITPGVIIPAFSAKATGDKTIRLSNYAGKYLVLYFYPKDSTPGCTVEGQNFRDSIDQFDQFNAVVLGVSRDSLKAHENFRSKQGFPFDLLSDADETLCQLFDVIKMKNMYGKEVRGIERSTFLIGPDGKLIKAWRKVSVKGHVAEVLQTLAEISKT